MKIFNRIQKFLSIITLMFMVACVNKKENSIYDNSEYLEFLKSSKSNSFESEKIGLSSPFGRTCPFGLFTSVPEITIEDDGNGYPSDILSKIGEPYLKSSDKNSGLGLGLFIGKTLLEKNFATVNCWNSQTRSGAEVTIKWKNKDLFNL